MSGCYYNEHDPFAAAWLRELIAGGHIADGVVDERDIQDVRPDDLRGFDQCHFFAGIGGWSLALRLAGWDDARPVWTGSCPCQPYSSAGKGEGADDPRNLWPHWFRLIRECRPPVVFGEQVEAAVRHGWLDAVSTDMEAEDYAFGAAVLGAHSVGAPHIRQRAYFVADAQGRYRRLPVQQRGSLQAGAELERGGEAVRLADPAGSRPTRTEQRGADRGAAVEGIRDTEPERDGALGFVGDSGGDGRQGRTERALLGAGWREERPAVGRASGAWADVRWLACSDGKIRPAPVEPALFPLAPRLPGRVGTLRGSGNSIVPQTAAAFIAAYREAVSA